MRILNRYLFSAIAGTTALVLVVLLTIGAFVEFVGQLDDVGEGDYTLITAVQFVLLKLPRRAATLLPYSVLLGTLLGLGALAANSELIVMRAAGVSADRMAKSIAFTGLLIAVLGGVVGEFIAPQLDLYARQMRAVAKSGGADMAGSSAWLRTGDTIFNVRPSLDGTDYGGVYVYRLGEFGRLTGIGRADSVESENAATGVAEGLAEGLSEGLTEGFTEGITEGITEELAEATDTEPEWILTNYQETRFGEASVSIATDFDVAEVAQLSDLLSITAVRESSLTGTELWAYIQYLKRNGLDADRYEIAFWSRIASIVGVAVMCMLALPFVFGSLRSTGAGTRILVGVLIGVGYFLFSRTMADSGAVFDLNPIVVAWLPTGILFIATVIGLRRLN